MIAITGNTYPVKDQLKALGGKWNADAKAWMVPESKADEARALVNGTPKQSSNHNHGGKRYFRNCNMERRVGGSRHMGGQSYHYTDSNGRRQFVLGDDD